MSWKQLEYFPRTPFLKVDVKELAFHRNYASHFLTTAAASQKICRVFTMTPSSQLLGTNLYLNVSGIWQDHIVDRVLDAFQKVRVISTVYMSGIQPLSKGISLAKLMITEIKDLEELISRAYVYEARGDGWLEANNFH